MKQIFLFLIVIIVACSAQKNQELTKEEIGLIKQEIIWSYAKHIEDLINLDYEEVMKFYADVDDHILFGDGLYWGDYNTIDQIWKSFCTKDNKLVLKWDLSEHHVYVFSRKAASYLVQFDNERIQTDGDTTKVTGCFSYGMKKFDDEWKVVTTHVTHNYLPGYDPRGKN
jgi:ketosteroid isomerase-like protein